MKYLRHGFKALGWLALGLGTVAVLVLAALTAANWRDAPLSEAAQQALIYAPPTEQALDGNGYLILMGLDAPAPVQGDATAAAVAMGRQRLAREIERRQWVDAHGNTTEGMPLSIPFEHNDDRVFPARLRCPASEADCFRWYRSHGAEIQALGHANQVLLQRLAAAANSPQFKNPAPFYLLAEFPPFSLLVRAHELSLAQASLQWEQGQAQKAMDITRQAAQLRTRLASGSDSLIASMIALAMQHRELRWLSDASTDAKQAALAEASKDIAEQLSTPPEPLLKALEGEKQFTASTLSTLKDASLYATLDEGTAWWQHLLDHGRGLVYLPNETLNESIENLQQLQVISGLPAHRIEAAFSETRQQRDETGACAPWKRLRNIAGHCLASLGTSSYQRYVQRVADMDGYRRLVLLQHHAAMQRIAKPDMPAWLAQSPPELRHPYTLQPMQWDAASSSLIFEGREHQNQNPDKSPIYRIRLRD